MTTAELHPQTPHVTRDHDGSLRGTVALTVSVVAVGTGSALLDTKLGAVAVAGLILFVAVLARRDTVRGHLLVVSTVALGAFPVIALKSYALAIPAAAVVVVIFEIATTRRAKVVPRGAGLLGVIYLMLGLATAVSGSRNELLLWALFATTAGVAFLLAGNLNNKERRIAFTGLVTFIFIQVVLAIWEVSITHRPLWALALDSSGQGNRPGTTATFLQSFLFDGAIRATGTLGHPLPMAFFFVLAFAITRSHHLEIGWRLRWAVYTLCVAGCLLGGARSALLAVAVIAVVGEFQTVRVRSFLLLAAAMSAYVFVGSGAITELLRINTLVSSGSYTHRSKVIDSLPALLSQPANSLFLGSGVNGEGRIITTLVGDNFAAVDNQFIASLITAGLAGFVCLIALIINAALIDRKSRLPLLGIAIMFMSFDALSWQASLALTAAVLGLAGSARSAASSVST